MTFRRLSAAVLGFVAITPVLRADDKAAVDAVIRPFLKDRPYLGLVVGVTRPAGRQVFGYGHVTLEGKSQRPARDTLFEIGSITKVFTGTLLADQVLAGKMRLDDPVQKHLPEGFTVPRRDDRDVSLLHLATHTSSLPVQPPLIGLHALLSKDPANPYAEYDLNRLKKDLAAIKLTRPIGSQYEYSNLGVGLLGHAVAHAAGTDHFEDLLVRRLAKPLGMSDTRMRLSPGQKKRFPPGHTDAGEPTSEWTFACLEACGGLRSTADDLLTFTDAHLGRPKSPLAEAFRLAHEPWRELPRRGEFVGLGWMRLKLSPSGHAAMWHNGGTGGYRSFLGFIPERAAGVIILSNCSRSVDALGDKLLEQLDKAE